MSSTCSMVHRLLAVLATTPLIACPTSSTTETQPPDPTHATTARTRAPGASSQPAEIPVTQSDMLAADVILYFEKVSLGNEAEANRRWQVSADGTVRFSKNRPPVPTGQVHNQPLVELDVLTADELRMLLDAARSVGFWDAPERVSDDRVEDGMSLRLILRDGNRSKRVVADNAASAVIDRVTGTLFRLLQND